MTQLAARTGVSDTYPLPSNATAKAALAAMWDVINEMSQAAEIDLASAATTNIGGQVSRKLRITGTTGITSFGTTYTGPIVLRFNGTLTITHHATTLICPGGANLTVAAGDVVIVTPKCTTSGTFDGWMIVARPDSQHAAINGSAVEAFAASGLTLTGEAAAITYNETNAGADLKKWLVYVDLSVYRVLTLTDAGASILQAFNLDRSGNLTLAGALTSLSPTAGIGYAAGAGGTVTQVTSITTGVTLNKACGQITTVTTNITANSNSVFKVTNSSFATTDMVTVMLLNGTTAGNVLCTADTISVTDGFNIRLTNPTASAAGSGTYLIGFSIHKAVIS